MPQVLRQIPKPPLGCSTLVRKPGLDWMWSNGEIRQRPEAGQEAAAISGERRNDGQKPGGLGGGRRPWAAHATLSGSLRWRGAGGESRRSSTDVPIFKR